MNRNIVVITNIGKRFITTATANKNVEVNVAIDEQKENYYKTLNAKISAKSNSKPVGWENALPYSSIPGPKPIPILGNFWRFLPYVGNLHNIDVLDMHKKFYKEYGNIMILKNVLVSNDVVIIYNPDDFEMLHRNEGVYPIRDALKVYSYYRKHIRNDVFEDVSGLTTVQDEQWFNFRSKVNPILMQPRTAIQYVSSMDHIAKDFITRIRNLMNSNSKGEMPGDFQNHLHLWALESIAYIALDKRLGCLKENLEKDSEEQKIINSVLEMFYLYYKLEVLPSIWKYYNIKPWKRFVKVMDTLTDILIKNVKQAEEKFLNSNTEVREHQKSVLQRLLAIDKKVALTMSSDLLTAGVDTTGRTVGAALYYLANYPEVQDKLRKEILSLLPDKNSAVTKETLEKCKYLKAVIKETTRIAPISIGNLRKTVSDLIIGGYQIPKGTDILTSNLVLCHSDQHFPKASEFIPERWERNNEGELSCKHVHPFVHLPFGFGPRSCIGKRLANLEMETLLSKVIRNFSVEWHHGDMEFSSTPLYGVSKPLKIQFKEYNG